MNTAKNVSTMFLSFSSMSHKKLQKLTYYYYCWFNVIYNREISGLYYEAWVHGPVNPEIYQLYKSYGWSEIPRSSYCPYHLDSVEYKVARATYDYYGLMSANELEELSHQELPWIKARKGKSRYDFSDQKLSITDIKSYYYETNEYKLMNDKLMKTA